MLRLLGLFVCAIPLCAADLTGQWAALPKAGGRTAPLHFEFSQSGTEVTGAFGYRSDFLWPLSAVRLESGKLTFILRMPSGPPATFEGTVADDSVSGQLTSAASGLTGPFEMKRIGPLSRLPAPLSPHNSPELSQMSDEFSDPETLRGWTTLSQAEKLPDRIERMDIGETSPGHLYILPKSAAWWAGYHGAYLFKVVRGDFVVTTRLKVTGKGGSEPSGIWTISGLLVRAPGDLSAARELRKENWIYLMTGRGPVEARVVDAKSTRDSFNAWDITPAQAGWYELRIARIGPVFILLCRPDGADWTVRKLVLRSDLPEALQVGVNVTSDFKLSASMTPARYNAEVFEGKSTIDATTLVDWVRFSAVPDRPQALAAIAGKPALEVRDAGLLRILE